jgi:hypothetical protein
MELRKRMHDPIAKTGAWLKRMLKGHLNYYAVSGNSPSLWWYFNEVRWRWLKSLKRRSQRAFMSWEFTSATDRFFPSIGGRSAMAVPTATSALTYSESFAVLVDLVAPALVARAI